MFMNSDSLLQYYVFNGEIQSIHELLGTPSEKSKRMVNETDSDNRTVLHVAVELGKEDIVKCLIDHGADVNKRTTDLQLAPIHMSVRSESVSITKLLLDHGADINIRNKIDLTPLHLAIITDELDMINLLLSRGANPNAVTRDRRTESPLLKASTTSLSLTKLLINSGANLTRGLKEILVALLANKPKIAIYLLSYVIEKVDTCQVPDPEIIDYKLLPNSIGKSHLQALCSHVTNCDPKLAIEIMNKLIYLGSDINYANHFGSLFPILISRTEKEKVTRALLDHLLSMDDADCDIFVATSGQAMTPATYAIQTNQFYFAKQLLIEGFANVLNISLANFKFTKESIETLKLLHYLGYQFPNDFNIANRPSSDADDVSFVEYCSWLEYETCNVMSLKNMIRVHLRKKYGRKILKIVSKVPNILKLYLLFHS